VPVRIIHRFSAWVNNRTQPCGFAFVLIDANPAQGAADEAVRSVALRGGIVAAGSKAGCQRGAVLDRLRRPLAHELVHRIASIADQRDLSAIVPLRWVE
jgi:hypothetical protein